MCECACVCVCVWAGGREGGGKGRGVLGEGLAVNMDGGGCAAAVSCPLRSGCAAAVSCPLRSLFAWEHVCVCVCICVRVGVSDGVCESARARDCGMCVYLCESGSE